MATAAQRSSAQSVTSEPAVASISNQSGKKLLLGATTYSLKLAHAGQSKVRQAPPVPGVPEKNVPSDRSHSVSCRGRHQAAKSSSPTAIPSEATGRLTEQSCWVSSGCWLHRRSSVLPHS